MKKLLLIMIVMFGMDIAVKAQQSPVVDSTLTITISKTPYSFSKKMRDPFLKRAIRYIRNSNADNVRKLDTILIEVVTYRIVPKSDIRRSDDQKQTEDFAQQRIDGYWKADLQKYGLSYSPLISF